MIVLLLFEIFITNCTSFFQLNDNARFTATGCSFENVEKGHAVVIETEKVTRTEKINVGSESSSVSLKNISLSECKFSNDDKGSITLRPKDTAALTQRHVNTVVGGPDKEEAMEL